MIIDGLKLMLLGMGTVVLFLLAVVVVVRLLALILSEDPSPVIAEAPPSKSDRMDQRIAAAITIAVMAYRNDHS